MRIHNGNPYRPKKCFTPNEKGSLDVCKQEWERRMDSLGSTINHWVENVPTKEVTEEFYFSMPNKTTRNYFKKLPNPPVIGGVEVGGVLVLRALLRVRTSPEEPPPLALDFIKASKRDSVGVF